MPRTCRINKAKKKPTFSGNKKLTNVIKVDEFKVPALKRKDPVYWEIKNSKKQCRLPSKTVQLALAGPSTRHGTSHQEFLLSSENMRVHDTVVLPLTPVPGTLQKVKSQNRDMNEFMEKDRDTKTQKRLDLAIREREQQAKAEKRLHPEFRALERVAVENRRRSARFLERDRELSRLVLEAKRLDPGFRERDKQAITLDKNYPKMINETPSYKYQSCSCLLNFNIGRGLKKGNFKRLTENISDWKLSSNCKCVVQVERLNCDDIGNNTGIKVKSSETIRYYDIFPKREPEDSVDASQEDEQSELKQEPGPNSRGGDGKCSKREMLFFSVDGKKTCLNTKCSVKLKRLITTPSGNMKNNGLLKSKLSEKGTDVVVLNKNNECQKRKIVNDIPSAPKQSDPTESFLCEQCDEFFTEDFVKHYQRMHPCKTPFKCSVCSYKTLRRSEFLLHYELHVSNSPVNPNTIRRKSNLPAKMESFRCSDCNLFFNENEFILHRRDRHQDEMPFKCGICELKSHQWLDFVKHFKLHNNYQKSSVKKCINSISKPKHPVAVSLKETTLIATSHEVRPGTSSKEETNNTFEDISSEFNVEPPSKIEPDEEVLVLSDTNVGLSIASKNRVNRVNDIENGNDDFIFKCHFCNVRFSSKPALDIHIRFHEYHKEKRDKLKLSKESNRTVESVSMSSNIRINFKEEDEVPLFKITDNDIYKSIEVTSNVNLVENIDAGDHLYLGEPQVVNYLNATSETQDFASLKPNITDELIGEPRLLINVPHVKISEELYSEPQLLINTKHNQKSEEIYGAPHVLYNKKITESCNEKDILYNFTSTEDLEMTVDVEESLMGADDFTADRTIKTKRFICKDCGLQFERRFHRAFSQHRLLQHHDETPFICEHCQMEFAHLTVLVRHMFFIHTGRVQCLYCDKEFAVINNAILHQENFHPQVQNESAKFSHQHIIDQYTDCETEVINTKPSMIRSSNYLRDSFPCKTCVKSFTTSNALIQHKRRCKGAHCICKTCYQIFPSPYARDQHFKDSPPCMQFVRDALNEVLKYECKKNLSETDIVITNVQSLSDPNSFVTYSGANFCETTLASTSSQSNSELGLQQATFESDSLSMDNLNFVE